MKDELGEANYKGQGAITRVRVKEDGGLDHNHGGRTQENFLGAIK